MRCRQIAHTGKLHTGKGNWGEGTVGQWEMKGGYRRVGRLNMCVAVIRMGAQCTSTALPCVDCS